MSQYTGTPKKWANTLQSWHIDAVLDIVLSISFGFHGGARRENVLLKKRPRRERWILPVVWTKMKTFYPGVCARFLSGPQGFAHK